MKQRGHALLLLRQGTRSIAGHNRSPTPTALVLDITVPGSTGVRAIKFLGRAPVHHHAGTTQSLPAPGQTAAERYPPGPLRPSVDDSRARPEAGLDDPLADALPLAAPVSGAARIDHGRQRDRLRVLMRDDRSPHFVTLPHPVVPDHPASTRHRGSGSSIASPGLFPSNPNRRWPPMSVNIALPRPVSVDDAARHQPILITSPAATPAPRLSTVPSRAAH